MCVSTGCRGQERPVVRSVVRGHTCYLEWPAGLEDDGVCSSSLPEAVAGHHSGLLGFCTADTG